MKGNYLTVPIGMIVLLFLPDNITVSQVTETVHNILYLHT